MEEVVEFEEIVDIPVLQIELVRFCGRDMSFFFLLLWHGALHTDFFFNLIVSKLKGDFFVGWGFFLTRLGEGLWGELSFIVLYWNVGTCLFFGFLLRPNKKREGPHS